MSWIYIVIISVFGFLSFPLVIGTFGIVIMMIACIIVAPIAYLAKELKSKKTDNPA